MVHRRLHFACESRAQSIPLSVFVLLLGRALGHHRGGPKDRRARRGTEAIRKRIVYFSSFFFRFGRRVVHVYLLLHRGWSSLSRDFVSPSVLGSFTLKICLLLRFGAVCSVYSLLAGVWGGLLRVFVFRSGLEPFECIFKKPKA